MNEATEQSLRDLIADWQAQAARWANPVPAGAALDERKTLMTGPAPSAHELLEACADQAGEVLRTGEMPTVGLPGQVVQLHPLYGSQTG